MKKLDFKKILIKKFQIKIYTILYLIKNKYLNLKKQLYSYNLAYILLKFNNS